jgi:hypothetical protein
LRPLEDALQVELDEKDTLNAETTLRAADTLACDLADVWDFIERDATNPNFTDGIFFETG